MLGAQGRGNPLALDQARGRLAGVWAEGALPLNLLIEGRAADPLMGDATYLLALCMHDQAERAQAKADKARRAGRTPSASDTKAAQDAWRDAARWWETYLEEHAQKPAAPAARWWRARVAEALGDKEAAAALLRNMAGTITPLEKTARLYRARQLQGQ
jgi:hypothetical protein